MKIRWGFFFYLSFSSLMTNRWFVYVFNGLLGFWFGEGSAGCGVAEDLFEFGEIEI
jgi:hypothetical protein